MGFNLKLLGAARISSAMVTPLYTASGAGAIVSNIRLVNVGGSSITINLFFRPSGQSQIRILDVNKSIAAGDPLVVSPDLTMAAGDAIELTTTGTPTLDWAVSGVEVV
jgi:hypothetical protein